MGNAGQLLRSLSTTVPRSTQMSNCYHPDTPSEVRDAKGLHLITTSTPNGKKVQIMLEELRVAYGTEFTHTLISIPTNEQKKDWFLKLNPNGRIPVLMDNMKSPPFPVMETSASCSTSSRNTTQKTHSASRMISSDRSVYSGCSSGMEVDNLSRAN